MSGVHPGGALLSLPCVWGGAALPRGGGVVPNTNYPPNSFKNFWATAAGAFGVHSGGTFPIETLPTFFQVVSKWLLFPYAVDAMHSAMAGSFGMEYWVSMGKLALFLVPSLLLGLMLRKPVIRFNDWVIRNLENTKVM